MSEHEYDVIGYRVREAEKQNDRGQLLSYHCAAASCPLRKRRKCVMVRGLWGESCPYGQVRTTESQTKRAKSYRGWLEDAQEEAKAQPAPGRPAERMAYIGEYVWLPYPHINHFDGEKVGLPFLAYSGPFMGRGSQFMKREHFDAEMVVKLCRFRPQALFGGSILENDTAARLLSDLRTLDAALYADAVALESSLADLAQAAERDTFPWSFVAQHVRSGPVEIGGQRVTVYSEGRRNVHVWFNLPVDVPDRLRDAVDGEPEWTCRARFEPKPATRVRVLDPGDAARVAVEWQKAQELAQTSE